MEICRRLRHDLTSTSTSTSVLSSISCQPWLFLLFLSLSVSLRKSRLIAAAVGYQDCKPA